MKIEIEKREYDRLKSREEKLLAYYDWWLDEKWAWKDLNTIEEVINDNIRLRAEIKKLKELLEITVQTKNEKIRNLLEELEFYEKQEEHSMRED